LAAVYNVEANRTLLPLRLDPAGSMFVVFRRRAQEDEHVSAVQSAAVAAETGLFPAFEFSLEPGGGLFSRAWQNGKLALQMASGKTIQLDITGVPPPCELGGAWELVFPPNWGAPDKITLEKLISWTEHENSGVKYFSGTASYSKNFDLPAACCGSDRTLVLDLGLVKNLAEVVLNGHNLGILWKPPFRVDISDVARAGENRLEVKVTNLWCNRLIGDEQLPEDIEWAHNGFWAHQGPQAWPAWLLQGQPRPSGRLTFTTWHYFNKNSPLSESGLLGPVMVRVVRKINVAELPRE
jgi:hypothetical protein